jgi:hypothetical protein
MCRAKIRSVLAGSEGFSHEQQIQMCDASESSLLWLIPSIAFLTLPVRTQHLSWEASQNC